MGASLAETSTSSSEAPGAQIERYSHRRLQDRVIEEHLNTKDPIRRRELGRAAVAELLALEPLGNIGNMRSGRDRRDDEEFIPPGIPMSILR